MFIQAKRVLLVVSFSAAAAMGSAGCDSGLGDCPTDSAAQETAGKTIVNSKCATAGCHNGANAAEGLNFSDNAVVKSNAAQMYGEVEEGAMPPGGGLSAEDIEALRVYLACTQ